MISKASSSMDTASFTCNIIWNEYSLVQELEVFPKGSSVVLLNFWLYLP